MGNGCCSHGGVTFSPDHATITQDNERNYNYCVYDSDISTGVVALLFLMASQILIMVASQCFCCGKALKPVGSRSLALLVFITCWVFFFIAEVCLLAGLVRNAYHTKYRTVFTDNPPSCQTLRKGVFGAGAAFVFLNCIVTELYYVFLFQRPRKASNHMLEKLLSVWEPTNKSRLWRYRDIVNITVCLLAVIVWTLSVSI